MRPTNRDAFEIAIICALTLEADPVEALFDETYDKFGKVYGTEPEDNNTYVTGRIGPHHVVLCYLPGMGKRSAASAAANLRMSYRHIQLALLVGVCGGVPFSPSKEEIILGDVVISSGIVEYDFGRQNPDGFRRKIDSTEALGRPSPKIRSFLAALKGKATRSELQEQTSQHLQSLQTRPNGWQRPANEQDVLFEPSYRHKHYNASQQAPCICLSCHSNKDPVCDQSSKSDCITVGCAGRVIHRDRLSAGIADSSIHIGKYASGDTVLKFGEHRDNVSSAEGVIAFEMEGAGVWDNVPCIIIKGVCDYADSHKNKIWQPYAAAAAASASKAFLQRWPAAPQQPAIMKQQVSDLAFALRSYYTSARRLQVQRISGELLPMERCYINMVLIKEARSSSPSTESDFSLWSRPSIATVDQGEHVSIPGLFMTAKRILIHGRAGVGKSTLCKKIMYDHINDGLWSDLFDLILWIPLRRLKRSSQQNGTLENAFYDLYFSDRSDSHALAVELKNTVMDVTQRDRVLLILDGLDEVSQAWEPETPMHNLLVRFLEHPRVIITSRPYGLGNSDLESYDMQLETVGFIEEQVEAYVGMASKGDPKRLDDILTFITGNEIIQTLVRIPVQLDAVCYSWDRNFMSRDSPKTMTLLYEAITLKLWQKDLSLLQQLDPSKGLAEDRIRGSSMLQIEGMMHQELRLLETLAFTGMHNGLVEFGADDRQRLYDALIQQGTLLPDAPESILKRVSFLHTSDTSVLDSDQTYHFLHLTFQEFFAARYFARHWMEKRDLECINLRERAPSIYFTQPQGFLQTHKYNARYDIMWRFTTGLLQDYPPQKHWSEDPVKHYFDQVDSEPRDILGPVHHQLLAHCLRELVPEVRDNGLRVRIEDQLLSWLLLESRMGMTMWRGLLADKECPEYLPVKLLQRHSRDVDTDVMSALLHRTSLSPVTIERILAILKDGDEHLRPSAVYVLLQQIRLPPDIIEALFLLPEHHSDSRLVENMVQQVGSFPQIVERLPLYQKSDDWHVRLAAGQALAHQSILPPGGLDALLLLLQDPERKVRADMAWFLHQRQPLESAIIEALIPLLDDEYSSVRVAAAQVWEGQDHIPSEVCDALHRLLQDKSDRVKVTAVAALSRHQPVTVSTLSVLVPVLKKARLPEPSIALWDAINLLEEQKSLPQDVVEALVALLQDGRGDIQLEISKILFQQQSSLTMTVQALLHDYFVLRLYTDTLGHQAPPMPTSHQNSILRIFRDAGEEVVMKAAHALHKSAQLSPDTLSALFQIMIADEDEDRSGYSAWILSYQSVLPMEIRDQLFGLLESECSKSLKNHAIEALLRETNLPPQVIKALLAEAKKDTSGFAIDVLSLQTNLPPAILEGLLPMLELKDSSSRGQVARMAMKDTQVLANLPAKYWAPLYEQCLKGNVGGDISWTLKGNCLCLDTTEGLTEVHFDRRHLIEFRREIRQAQLRLGIPADTLLPEPRWQDWLMSLAPY